MATKEKLSRLRAAFNIWDTTGAGTIDARDLCNVIEFLGETPALDPQVVFEHRDPDDHRICFDEFVTIIVGWSASGLDQRDALDVIAELDDGNGHVLLRDLVRVVHDNIENFGYQFSESEMLDLYRKALDVSLFETAGGSLEPDVMWKVFEDEFAEIYRGQGTANVHSVDFKDRTVDDGEPTLDTADMLSVTVVGLGGTKLLVDAFPSTWSKLALQQHVEKVVGVPIHRQALFLTGDGFTHGLCLGGACLSASGVVDGSTLLLLVKDEMKLDYKKFLARLMDP